MLFVVYFYGLISVHKLFICKIAFIYISKCLGMQKKKKYHFCAQSGQITGHKSVYLQVKIVYYRLEGNKKKESVLH